MPITSGKALARANVAPPTAQPMSRAAGVGRSPVKSWRAVQCRSQSKASSSQNWRALLGGLIDL